MTTTNVPYLGVSTAERASGSGAAIRQVVPDAPADDAGCAPVTPSSASARRASTPPATAGNGTALPLGERSSRLHSGAQDACSTSSVRRTRVGGPVNDGSELSDGRARDVAQCTQRV